MPFPRAAWLAASVLLVSGPAYAGLTGSNVEASLQFFGSNFNYFVPNTATIESPGIEFFYQDSANVFTADFNDASLTIIDQAAVTGTNVPLTMTFTDQAFEGMSSENIGDSFAMGGLNLSIAGPTITIEWAGGPVEANTESEAIWVFSGMNDPAVPEPSTRAIVLIALAGLALLVRRR